MKNNKNNKAVVLRMVFQFLTVFIFFGSSVIMGILFFALPKTGYSEIEKRKLTEFPKLTFTELANGNFTDNLTKYVSDNFAFRDILVDLGFKLQDKRGIRLDGVKIYSSENSNEYIIEEIFSNEAVLYCPHGRPVIYELTKQKLDKIFDRL